jgi:hypothetical protein
MVSRPATFLHCIHRVAVRCTLVVASGEMSMAAATLDADPMRVGACRPRSRRRRLSLSCICTHHSVNEARTREADGPS